MACCSLVGVRFLFVVSIVDCSFCGVCCVLLVVMLLLVGVCSLFVGVWCLCSMRLVCCSLFVVHSALCVVSRVLFDV